MDGDQTAAENSQGDAPVRQNNRRDVLLSAAARLFASKGYEATSMRDIASAIGMMPGSLYYHFPSKDELFVAVHGAGIAGIGQAVRDALEGCGKGPWERLEAAACAHLEALLRGGDLAAVVSPDFPTRDPGVRARLIAQRDAYEAMIQELIDALPLPRDADRAVLRLQILGGLNWTTQWYRDGRLSPTMIARAMIGHLRAGLDPTRAP